MTIILLWGLWFKSCIHPDELQKSVLFVSPRILGGFQVVSCKKAVCITKAITEITWAIFPRPTSSAISRIRTLEGLLTGERTDLIIEWVPSSWCQCSGYTSIKNNGEKRFCWQGQTKTDTKMRGNQYCRIWKRKWKRSPRKDREGMDLIYKEGFTATKEQFDEIVKALKA